MRAFVTGGTGFLGGRLVAQLRARGDQVAALVRSPARAARLRELGCELVEGDLSSQEPLTRAMSACDAVFHAAAVYRIGILPREAETMRAANVEGTAAVLDAAAAAEVPRVVYVSTNNVFGNTRGQLVDETYERPPGEWLSAYDESKYLAHQLARERSAQGAPIVIVQPGGIYGPGDHTQMGALLARAAQGKRVFLPLGDVGLNFVYVEDAAAGVLLAHDRGRLGESYVLGGEIATLRQAIETAFAAAGSRPRIVPVPTALLRLVAPLGPLLRTNVREVMRASAGVTYWGKDDRARRELGYAPRDLASGLRAGFP
ncbi:MAG: NAD-dependent epimerase/dehydratase family protein [Gaiellaceae bacterium]